MDGNKLETILTERDDYIETLVALVIKLTTHHFIASNQSAYFVQSKENVDHETCVLVSDFHLRPVLTDLNSLNPTLKRVKYFTEGTGTPYKNKKNFANLSVHIQNFQLEAE